MKTPCTLYGIELTHHDEESIIDSILFTSYEKAEKMLIEEGYEQKLNSRNKKFYEKDCHWMYANIREFTLAE